MGSGIEHRVEFAHAPAEVLAAQSEPEPLRARLEHLGGTHAGLSEHEHTADGVRYTLLQGIAAEQLPKAVRSLHRGDLVVRREQSFERSGEGYTGTTTAGVDGIPGEITARTEITPHDGYTVQRTTGEAKVRMPVVGGKLEAAIAEQVAKLLEREAEFTKSWLDDSR